MERITGGKGSCNRLSGMLPEGGVVVCFHASSKL